MVTLSFSVTVLGSCSYHRSFSSIPNPKQIFRCMYAAALLWRWKFSVFPNSGQPETRWSKVLSNGHRICILPKSLSSSPPPPPLFSSLYSKLTCYCCTCTCTYPVVNERWGATDVATVSLHFILFSASLTVWQNFNPVHSAMLFSQRFFCRPLLLPLALFLVKSSWQALMILIHAQTTLTSVS